MVSMQMNFRTILKKFCENRRTYLDKSILKNEINCTIQKKRKLVVNCIFIELQTKHSFPTHQSSYVLDDGWSVHSKLWMFQNFTHNLHSENWVLFYHKFIKLLVYGLLNFYDCVLYSGMVGEDVNIGLVKFVSNATNKSKLKIRMLF